MKTSVPDAFSPGVYSIHSVPSVAVPIVGGWSIPTRVTESPSGSMPLRGTGMRMVCPALAQAVSALGWGAEFAWSAPITLKLATALAVLPAESVTV